MWRYGGEESIVGYVVATLALQEMNEKLGLSSRFLASFTVPG